MGHHAHKNGSLFYQMTQRINQNFKEGTSKNSVKGDVGRQMTAQIFSYSSFYNLKDTAKNLCAYIKEHHPEIRTIDQITNQHCLEYLQSKSETCNARSLNTYINNINKLGLIAQKSENPTFGHIPTIKVTEPKTRDVWMKPEHMHSLADRLQSQPDSGGKRALTISLATGIRVRECCMLRGVDIKGDKVEYIGKGGRHNITAIRPEYREIMQNMAEQYKQSKIAEIRPKSADAYLHRQLEALGIDKEYRDHKTGFHAIRKENAQEFFHQQMAEGSSVRDALNATSNNLGHGDYREDVDSCYTH